MTLGAVSVTIPPRRALVDDVYDALLSLLMDQEIAPGARLSIDGVARQLDVSPTPVREALTRLEAEGLVLREARKGYTAAELLDAEGLDQLYELRILLEPRAARLATARLDAAARGELAAQLRGMRQAAASDGAEAGFRNYRDFAERDAAFHHTIARASGNPLLADAIIRLRSHVHLYRLYFQHGIADDTADEHAAILTALEAGDADAAELAMRTHLETSRARLVPRADEAAE